jgi:hypothetical protein
MHAPLDALTDRAIVAGRAVQAVQRLRDVERQSAQRLGRRSEEKKGMM